MTRQAISPRFAIKIRLNMFFLVTTFGGFRARNRACGDGGHNCVYSKMRRRQRSFSVLRVKLPDCVAEDASEPLACAAEPQWTVAGWAARPMVNPPGLWEDRCQRV